jgi:hypothetical protein
VPLASTTRDSRPRSWNTVFSGIIRAAADLLADDQLEAGYLGG